MSRATFLKRRVLRMKKAETQALTALLGFGRPRAALVAESACMADTTWSDAGKMKNRDQEGNALEKKNIVLLATVKLVSQNLRY